MGASVSVGGWNEWSVGVAAGSGVAVVVRLDRAFRVGSGAIRKCVGVFWRGRVVFFGVEVGSVGVVTSPPLVRARELEDPMLPALATVVVAQLEPLKVE